MSWMTTLIAARLRRRPGRYLLAALGVTIAVAFAGAVVGEATIAGDRSAHRALMSASPLDLTVRISWPGVVTPAVSRAALGALDQPSPTDAVTLSPVRLGGTIVRLAAVAPLGRWLAHPAPLGPCRSSACPMLLVGGGTLARRALVAHGLRIEVVGREPLRSPVPLGFAPGSAPGPVLVTDDVTGLSRIPALSSVFRETSWVAPLSVAHLHSWDLAGVEARLRHSQANLLASDSGFSFTGPFAALEAARARARGAPSRLLLSGGGALAALAAFIVLAAGALRRDLGLDLGRLRLAGATPAQALALAVGEPAVVCGVAVLAGWLVALGVVAILAGASGDAPIGVLEHSLLTWPVAAGALGAWACATALIAGVASLPRRLVLLAGDVTAVTAVAALALALAQGSSGSDPVTLLLAPLACLAAGALVFRGAALALRAFERAARAASPLVRVALTGLARGPGLASLAAASIAISIGIGAFALSYRATLLRSAADRAAAQVPLDATIAAGADFRTPLELAGLNRWRTLSGGTVLLVRRTEASYLSGGETVTVPALGVPAARLGLLHGWRQSDGSAPLSALGKSLTVAGAVRVPGPRLPADARWLSVRATSPGAGVRLTADLRDRSGGITQLPLGTSNTGRPLRAAVPPGRWELEALEIDEPTGLEVTNAHQAAEGAPAPQFSTVVRLGSIAVLGHAGQRIAEVSAASWRGVGAAGSTARSGVFRFSGAALPGLVRPTQPSDSTPLPVLADPRTAASAGRGHKLSLTVDGVPLRAKLVGVVRRFPTIAAGAAGVVVADADALDAALDAAQPGQGRANELWVATPAPDRLRAALGSGPLTQLSGSFRSDIEHRLRSDPIARGVLGTLLSAAAVGLALAVVGMLAALIGGGREPRLAADLSEQGIGPRGLRRELRLRFAIASVSGVVSGALVGIALIGLAVAGVRAAFGPTQPTVIAVLPLGALLLFVVVALGALAAAGALLTVRQR
jgi:hypothetical protein